MTKSKQRVRNLAVTGMLAAIAGVLMILEFPLPFIAPPFLRLDFSEIPVLIGGFALGPIPGIAIAFIKNIVKIVIAGTYSFGIGELANFLLSCLLVVPAALIYKRKKTRTSAVIGMVVGTLSLVVGGFLINMFITIPAFSGGRVEGIVEMGKSIFPFVNDLFTFCLFCVSPFNLLKGILISVPTFILYKPLSNLIHGKENI